MNIHTTALALNAIDGRKAMEVFPVNYMHQRFEEEQTAIAPIPSVDQHWKSPEWYTA